MRRGGGRFGIRLLVKVSHVETRLSFRHGSVIYLNFYWFALHE